MPEPKNSQPIPKKTQTVITMLMGKRLREIRISNGWSQTDLAKRLGGLSFQQIQKYERGTNRISAASLQIIATTFQVPLDYFFQDISIGVDGLQINTKAPEYSRKGLELLRVFDELTPMAQSSLLAIAKSIRDGLRDYKERVAQCHKT